MNVLLLVTAVALLSSSQVLQKLGAERRLRGQSRPRAWAAALISPEILGAGVCIAAGTIVWLAVLYRVDVSLAFPFLSLCSVLVVAASRVFLGEPVPPRRWMGVALIAAGVALVASS